MLMTNYFYALIPRNKWIFFSSLPCACAVKKKNLFWEAITTQKPGSAACLLCARVVWMCLVVFFALCGSLQHAEGATLQYNHACVESNRLQCSMSTTPKMNPRLPRHKSGEFKAAIINMLLMSQSTQRGDSLGGGFICCQISEVKYTFVHCFSCFCIGFTVKSFKMCFHLTKSLPVLMFSLLFHFVVELSHPNDQPYTVYIYVCVCTHTHTLKVSVRLVKCEDGNSDLQLH